MSVEQENINRELGVVRERLDNLKKEVDRAGVQNLKDHADIKRAAADNHKELTEKIDAIKALADKATGGLKVLLVVGTLCAALVSWITATLRDWYG